MCLSVSRSSALNYSFIDDVMKWSWPLERYRTRRPRER